MLRFPIYGFAKRADDTVVRAMSILQTKPDYTAKPVARAPVAADPAASRPSMDAGEDPSF